MMDPALERRHGWFYRVLRRQAVFGAASGRCQVCGCMPAAEYTHVVGGLEDVPRHVTTCASWYCRLQSDVRYTWPAVESVASLVDAAHGAS